MNKKQRKTKFIKVLGGITFTAGAFIAMPRVIDFLSEKIEHIKNKNDLFEFDPMNDYWGPEIIPMREKQEGKKDE